MLLDDLSKLFQTQRNSESGFLYLLFGCVYKLFTACFFTTTDTKWFSQRTQSVALTRPA